MEPINALARDATIGKVAAGRLCLRLVQKTLVKLLLGPSHCLIQRPFIHSPLDLAADRFERNAGLICQEGQRLRKRDPLHFHHEAEDIPAGIATANPALERLAFGIDLEAGASVVVPGTESDVVAALAAKLNVLAHQLDDIDRLADLLFCVEQRTQRHLQLPSGKTRKIHFASRTILSANPLPATHEMGIAKRKYPKCR